MENLQLEYILLHNTFPSATVFSTLCTTIDSVNPVLCPSIDTISCVLLTMPVASTTAERLQFVYNTGQ
jgi:hypothetical protein